MIIWACSVSARGLPSSSLSPPLQFLLIYHQICISLNNVLFQISLSLS